MRLHLPGVTLACIDGRHPEQALYAMRRCMAQIDFGRVVLFSTEAMRPRMPPDIELVPIDGRIRSVEDYSDFVLRDLPSHVATPHVLIVQWDGFVLDTASWTDEFLQCDYIGAPWRHRNIPVGNGGFSLRSLALMQAVQAMPLATTHPEDSVVCHTCRPALEARGLRFASVDLARRFAFEADDEREGTFGFHGCKNMHRALTDAQFDDYLAHCPPDLVLSRDFRRLARDAMKYGRTSLAMRLLARRVDAGGWRHRLGAAALVLRLPFYWARYRLTGKGGS